MTDRVGRSRAIVHELRIGLVFRDRLILHERVDERLERVDRDLVARDGLGQRNHDRVPRLALVHGPQLAAPPFQKLDRSRGVADLVAQVVGPAAKGVDALKCRSVFARRQPGHHAEVFVVRGRQVGTVGAGFVARDAFGGLGPIAP